MLILTYYEFAYQSYGCDGESTRQPPDESVEEVGERPRQYFVRHCVTVKLLRDIDSSIIYIKWQHRYVHGELDDNDRWM